MFAELPVAEIDGHGVRFSPAALTRVVELQYDAGVLDDDRAAHGRPLRVERHERALRPQHGEEPDDHLGRAAQRDPDDLLGAESARDQVVGQLGGVLVYLTVRQ